MSNTRLVILVIGLIALGSLGGIIYLSATDKSIPDVLVGLATGGLGSLGSLLVNARGGDESSGETSP